jgi:hypothetical protein
VVGTVSKRCGGLLGCALLLGVSAGTARAVAPSGGGASTRGLEYDVPPECPSRPVWIGRVLDRLQGASHTWSAQELEDVTARVTVRASGLEAIVELDEGGLARSIRGADCDEVTSAAALILAVALSASTPASSTPASTSPTSPPAGTSSEGSKSDAPSPATTASPVLERKAPRHRSRAAPRASAAAALPSAQAAVEDRFAGAEGRERGDLEVELGAYGELNGWTAPGPAWLASLAVDLVSRAGWSARGAAVYGTSEASVGARRAAFGYWGAHIDLCPFVRGAIRWRWSACTELHAGLLLAEGDEGSALASGRTQRALLAAGAVSTRLEAPPVWGGRIGVEAGIAVPLLRQAFQFESPTEVVFESPPLGLFGRVGLQVAFGGPGD